MGKDNNLEWVAIYTATLDYEANIIKGLLESEGIFCLLKSFRIAQFPFDIGHQGEVKIMVPSTEAEKGKQIIQEHLLDQKDS